MIVVLYFNISVMSVIVASSTVVCFYSVIMTSKCVNSTDCVVILKREKPVLMEEEQRHFCLGLPGWCPCPDCSLPDAVSMETARAKNH